MERSHLRVVRCRRRIPLSCCLLRALVNSALQEVFVLKNHAKLTTQRLVFLALMIALNVVLGRFSIQLVPEIRLSVLGFLPIALSAMLMGPFYGALTGAVGDVLNFLLFTHVYGGYFPGYTVTAALSGLWYGMVLYKKPLSWLRATLAIVPVIVVGEMGLNSVWTYILYSKSFWAKLPMRLLTNVVECPLKILLLMAMKPVLARVSKSGLRL